MTDALEMVLLGAAPIVPVVLGLALFWWPQVAPALRVVAPYAPLPALAASVLVTTDLAGRLPWLLEGTDFGLDGTSQLFLFFTAAIWLAAGIFARASIGGPGDERFMPFFLLAMGGNFGLIVAHELLAFYLGFALMSFAAYGLIVHDGSAAARRAGRVYLVLVVTGDMLLYAALVLAAADTGGMLQFGAVREAIAESPHGNTVVLLSLAGFGVKAGLIGLHVALPLIYAAAPAPAGAALAGAMLNAGLLGWLRFLPLGSAELAWGAVLIVLGTAAAVYGVLIGVLQREARAVLAYSSVSQIGIVTAAIGVALRAPEQAGAIVAAIALFALHHGFAKGALFLGLGATAGQRPRSAWQWVGLLLPSLALAGAPLTSGMLAKEALKEALGGAPDGAAAAIATWLPWSSVLTTLIMARFLWLCRGKRGEGRVTAAGQTARSASIAWIMLLALSAVAAWLLPSGGAAARASAATLWSAAWPLAIGAVVAAGAARRPWPRPSMPPGDVLVALEAAVRAVRTAWAAVAEESAARALEASRSAFRAGVLRPSWLRAADAAEGALARWNVATALLIVLIVVLAAIGLWR